ncbi:hypothetical protein [Psychromarinibacter sp. S121]|uniref:hypothetical protein n=1 Tax=Psychromarinibacter sp. S121 TaxID=3415127 RepID=UPI003C7EAC3C
MSRTTTRTITGLVATAAMLTGSAALADQVFNDDLIISGSACIGFDCVNGESFGFDTIRLKENNIRIKFDDTSNSGSFPNVDWQLTINETSNGGANKFSIDDVTNARTPFTIEAAAPSHSLYVDDGGRIGLGTASPAVELHVVDGDSPTLRLQQDGSSGFTPQIWDVAGNETNFFIRDVTNGSKLSFKIKPGAPENSLFLSASGNVGLGTASPESDLHIRDVDGNSETVIRMEETESEDVKIELDRERFFISFDNQGGAHFLIRQAGDVEIGLGNLEINNGHDLILAGGGSVVVNGTTLNVPDYVFAPDYDLMPLPELAAFIEANSHLPGVPSAAEVNAGGLNLTEMQFALLEKVEEQTLYILQLQEALAAQQDQIESLQAAR